MRHAPLLATWLVMVLSLSCGGKPASREPPRPETTESAAADAGAEPVATPTSTKEDVPASGIPRSCHAGSQGACIPDPAFVRRLCNTPFFDVALTMFAKDSPFTRMYMKGDVEAWNADGGASARARLAFDEEVLALRKRGPAAGGVVVGSGGAGWLVLRWDGNCYSLEDGELTEKRPPQPKGAPLPFRLYEPATKDALLKNAKILGAWKKRGKECKGAISGEVSRACEQADAALSAQIVWEIRAGLTLPAPSKVP
jgi:hypothetical protein